MSTTVASARRIVGKAQRIRLKRRPDDDLPFVDQATGGGALLLDTSVYIDQMQGRLPPRIADVARARVAYHSVISLQELLFTVGMLDPADDRTAGIVSTIDTVVSSIAGHRLLAAQADILGTAAVYAGILARTQGYAKDDRRRALNDCVLFLQARKVGLTVLTRNLRDFDLLLQLVPSGRVLFYR